jgi:hypothetical protein
MKPRTSLIALALIVYSSVLALGNSVSANARRIRLQSVLTDTASDLKPLERAYLDAATLLADSNSCSKFFGSAASTRALEELVVNLREEPTTDTRTGLRMSGSYKVFVNNEGAVLYRIFADAQLNTHGPFYKAKSFPSEPYVPNVGSFRPNTRPARVLILLHELAHLMQKREGEWLIPDDGYIAELSRQNTMTIESKCGAQLKALS